MNPLVDRVITADGKSIKSWEGCTLKSLRSKFRKNAPMDMDMDMDISWKMGENRIKC